MFADVNVNVDVDVDADLYMKVDGDATYDVWYDQTRIFGMGGAFLVTNERPSVSERPLTFFSILAGFLAEASPLLAFPVVAIYWRTGPVTRLPTAILSTGPLLSNLLSLACGAILRTVTLGRQEGKRLIYLSIPRLQRNNAS